MKVVQMIYEETDLLPQEQTQKNITLGARGSTLSKWQANFIAKTLEKAWPGLSTQIRIIKTEGDLRTDVPLPEIGGRGVFTAALEHSLLHKEVDLAVHSFKDLPVEETPLLALCPITKREDPRDVLVSRKNYTLKTLPKGATVGTSSTRRSAQILYLRPDLKIANIRGNVDTRIRKAFDVNGEYDAIVLAYAGLIRIGLAHLASEVVDIEKMLPAPAQGALALQCLKDSNLHKFLTSIEHFETRVETDAERSFLNDLGGGCSLPVAALAECKNNFLKLKAAVIAKDGQAKIELEMQTEVDSSNKKASSLLASQLGKKMALKAWNLGADKLLSER